MKSESHQDIIKQMADRLREHSVPYQEGAWERFKEVDKKRSRHLMLWPYLSAAAVILVAIILFLNPVQKITVTNELADRDVKKKEYKEENHVKEPVAHDLQAKPIDKEVSLPISVIEQNTALVSALEANITKNGLDDSKTHIEIETNLEEMTAYHNEDKGISGNNMLKEAIVEPSLLASIKEKKESVDFLTALSSIKEDESFHVNKSIDKKWSVGVEVSPNIGSNKQVNIGGGVAFAYSVSPKVSFSSGVSYLQVDAEGMPRASSQLNSPAAAPSFDVSSVGVAFPGGRSQTKTLHKIEANLVGLDIPFAINYHVNERFYASAGVSVFNVFNEGRMNQFENLVVDIAYRGEENKTPEPVVHTFYSQETANEKLYEGKSLNGFFNFSVGYSIPVSKKVGLSIEPFFKIQMGTLAEEDMNLNNGGIKISTRF